MAYSTQEDLEVAAGTPAALAELADRDDDGEADFSVVTAVIAEADAWINVFAGRLHGVSLPLSPVHEQIRNLSKHEAVYRLKVQRRVAEEPDHEQYRQRLDMLERMAAGQWSPVVGDVYPFGGAEGAGGGGPTVRSRSVDDVAADGTTRPSRDSMKGFW